jgi:Bacteriophage KPP10, Structural protein ORF10
MYNYSFKGLAGAMAHPSLGAFIFTGLGIGSINVTKTGENTAHSVAADGVAMVSHVINKTGMLAIQCQQNSDVDQWLRWAFNLLDNTNPETDWALMVIELIDSVGQKSTTATGVSFQKAADLPYQAQGQMVTWNLMAASVVTVTA